MTTKVAYRPVADDTEGEGNVSIKNQDEHGENEDQTNNNIYNLNEDDIPISMKFMIISFGLSSLLPWYMVINAAAFFRIRLKATHFEDTFANYLQASGIVCMILGGVINLCLSKKINYRFLCFGANAALGVLIGIICLLSSLNTDSWSVGFFILCLIIMVFISFSHSILNSNMIAIISMVQPSLTVW